MLVVDFEFDLSKEAIFILFGYFFGFYMIF